ncbi:MAG: twin-arginine translocase TatA/TatE family subunit [Acidothermus sp.]|nr:twin-arginine translocase TatA/TatE family subunit [Acidothermus sp.]
MPFDLSTPKLLVLGLLALIIFGPDKLPQIARDAARFVRQLRTVVHQARNELRTELGDLSDVVAEFRTGDLNPKTLIRRHVLDGLDGSPAAQAAAPGTTAPPSTARSTSLGRPTPYDPDAT